MKFLGFAITVAALLLAGPAPSTIVRADPIAAVAASADAPIALVYDMSAGQELAGRDAGKGFLPASMTKAMTTLVVFDLIRAGKIREDTLVTISPETALRWAGRGTTLNLRSNEQVLLSDLLMGTTVVSANDASVALAEAALGSTAGFVAAMNARAKALGMTDSHFGTPSGLPDRAATYTTAYDLVKLAEALIGDHPALYRKYVGRKAMLWRGQRLTSHDPFAEVVPGADGIKTGHTSEAGFNFLGAVERQGRRLVVIIAQAPTEQARTASSRALVEWGFGAFESRPFLTEDRIVGTVQIQDGNRREVPVAVSHDSPLILRRGMPVQVRAQIVYNGPVRAPVTKGTQIAELKIWVPGVPVHTVPLVATRSVAKAGPIDRIVNALLRLVA